MIEEIYEHFKGALQEYYDYFYFEVKDASEDELDFQCYFQNVARFFRGVENGVFMDEYSTDLYTLRFTTGAEKVVVFSDLYPDYVLKIPVFDNWQKSEYDIYQEAVEEGLERYFAKAEKPIQMTFGDRENPWEVTAYLMEYAEAGLDFASGIEEEMLSTRNLDEKSKECIESISYYTGQDESHEAIPWITRYGGEVAENLFAFLSNIDTNDFHSGNVGEIAGELVLIDYNGYM